MASICACGSSNDVDHAFSCGRGGYVIMRHNKIRDVTASFLREVATCVEVEPKPAANYWGSIHLIGDQQMSRRFE